MLNLGPNSLSITFYFHFRGTWRTQRDGHKLRPSRNGGWKLEASGTKIRDSSFWLLLSIFTPKRGCWTVFTERASPRIWRKLAQPSNVASLDRPDLVLITPCSAVVCSLLVHCKYSASSAGLFCFTTAMSHPGRHRQLVRLWERSTQSNKEEKAYLPSPSDSQLYLDHQHERQMSELHDPYKQCRDEDFLI